MMNSADETDRETELDDSEEEAAEVSGSEELPSEETFEEAGEPTLQEEVDKWKDVAARAQADLENFRKRMAREKAEAIVYANRSLLEEILPIIDNFEMGLRAAKDSDGEDSMIYQGMSMVFKQIGEFLSSQGVEIIESDGLAFNPNVHEAIKQEPSDSVPENHIIYTMRRGYRLKDRVLRAANVVVSSGTEAGD